MADTVEIRIGSQIVNDYVSYSVDSNIYQAANGASIVLTGSSAVVERGDVCEVRIADQLALAGVVDRVRKGYSREGRSCIIEVVDYLGILVNSSCREFKTLRNKTLLNVADELLRGLPHIGRVTIEYSGAARRRESAQAYRQIEPGQTVFDVLREMAIARGQAFYLRYDRTRPVLTFRVPRGRGDTVFSLTMVDGQNQSGIVDAEIVRSALNQHRTVTVVGQQQDSGDSSDPATVNVVASATDSEAPLDIHRVLIYDGDSAGPAAMASMAIEQARAAANELRYTVFNHTQGGELFRTDELVAVWDEALEVYGTWLIYGCTLSGSKRGGQRTTLRLGPPGLVQA